MHDTVQNNEDRTLDILVHEYLQHKKYTNTAATFKSEANIISPIFPEKSLLEEWFLAFNDILKVRSGNIQDSENYGRIQNILFKIQNEKRRHGIKEYEARKQSAPEVRNVRNGNTNTYTNTHVSARERSMSTINGNPIRKPNEFYQDNPRNLYCNQQGLNKSSANRIHDPYHGLDSSAYVDSKNSERNYHRSMISPEYLQPTMNPAQERGDLNKRKNIHPMYDMARPKKERQSIPNVYGVENPYYSQREGNFLERNEEKTPIQDQKSYVNGHFNPISNRNEYFKAQNNVENMQIRPNLYNAHNIQIPKYHPNGYQSPSSAYNRTNPQERYDVSGYKDNNRLNATEGYVNSQSLGNVQQEENMMSSEKMNHFYQSKNKAMENHRIPNTRGCVYDENQSNEELYQKTNNHDTQSMSFAIQGEYNNMNASNLPHKEKWNPYMTSENNLDMPRIDPAYSNKIEGNMINERSRNMQTCIEESQINRTGENLSEDSIDKDNIPSWDKNEIAKMQYKKGANNLESYEKLCNDKPIQNKHRSFKLLFMKEFQIHSQKISWSQTSRKHKLYVVAGTDIGIVAINLRDLNQKMTIESNGNQMTGLRLKEIGDDILMAITTYTTGEMFIHSFSVNSIFTEGHFENIKCKTHSSIIGVDVFKNGIYTANIDGEITKWSFDGEVTENFSLENVRCFVCLDKYRILVSNRTCVYIYCTKTLQKTRLFEESAVFMFRKKSTNSDSNISSESSTMTNQNTVSGFEGMENNLSDSLVGTNTKESFYSGSEERIAMNTNEKQYIYQVNQFGGEANNFKEENIYSNGLRNRDQRSIGSLTPKRKGGNNQTVRFIICFSDKIVVLDDQLITVSTIPTSNKPICACFGPDNKLIYGSYTQIHRLESGNNISAVGSHANVISGVEHINLDDKSLLVTCSYAGDCKIWEYI